LRFLIFKGGKDMMLATVRMAIPAQKRAEALKILKSIAGQSKVYSGCLGCHVYEDAQEDNVIMYEEVWRSEEDLERRLRSPEYRAMLLVMEMAHKHPEVRFNKVSASKGIEMIEKARGAAC
jgi:quinol monooxygenase YgiN